MKWFQHRLTALIGLVFAFSITAPTAINAAVALLNPQVSGALQVAAGPPFQLTPDGARVVFAAGIDGEARRLFSAPTDGSSTPISLSGPGSFNNRLGAFALSPDGSRVVFLFEDSVASDQFDLYSAPIEGGEMIKLNGNLPASANITGFAISPDGSYVVYRADIFTDESFELFSVPIAGGALLRINKAPIAGGSIEPDFAFSPDSARVVYRGDLDANDVIELYRSQVDSSGSTRISGDLVLGGDVQSFKITPNSAGVLYLADQETNGSDELYRVPMNAGPGGIIVPESTTATKLNGELAFGGSVKEYLLSPNGDQVVYRADVEQFARNELFRVAVGGGTPIKLSGELVAGGTIFSDFALSPDGVWLLYRADAQTADTTELFAVPLGGGAPLKLNSPLVAGGNVINYAISPNSRRIVYRADQQTDEAIELYSAQLPATPPVTTNGAAQAVGGNTVKLNGELLVPGATVQNFTISPAGDRVVYRAIQDTLNTNEIYSVPIAGGAATKLNGALVDGGDVSRFQISSDGTRVIYRADQETDEVKALFAAFEQPPTIMIEGPTGPLAEGAHELSVSLSQPLELSGIQVQLAHDGDAIDGEDYLLLEQTSIVVEGVKVVTSSELFFAAGEAEKTLTLIVLPNPDRTEPRTLSLGIAQSAGVNFGTSNSLDLTLAPANKYLFTPMLTR